MLAHFARADVVALVFQQQVEVAHDDLGTLAHRRPRQALARAQVVRELAENPGIALRGPADHDGLAARDFADAVEVVIRPHIAIRDDGDADRAAHFADFFPVRMAAVKLLARAAVHRDGIDACRLGAFRQVHDVDGALVPADAHLDRERHLDRLADGREDGRRALRVAHERRALAILDDFRRGTAHVEIEDVGRAELFDIGRRLGRHLWASRENLHGERPLGGLGLQHRERALIFEMDALARHHFGIAERTAHVVRDDAVGRVRHARHRREEDGRVK